MEEDENAFMDIVREADDVSDSGQKMALALSAYNCIDGESCAGGWNSMQWHWRRNCNYVEGWILISCSSVELKSN